MAGRQPEIQCISHFQNEEAALRRESLSRRWAELLNLSHTKSVVEPDLDSGRDS